MDALIDSSILIECERGRLDLTKQVENRREDRFFLSVVTASELLHGAHRAIDASVRSRRAAYVEAILEGFPIMEIDLATARAHARIWAELAIKGNLIGPHDLWLAAACLAHGLSIVTANVREFERVPALVIED